MERDRYLEAIESLASLLQLTPEAIEIAQGWSVLPTSVQRHVKVLIDDYIAQQIPLLAPIYANTSHPAQLRFNRIVERIQGKYRDMPPAPGGGYTDD